MNEDKFCIDELASIRAFCINSDKEDIYKYIYSLQKRIDKAIDYINKTNFWGLYEDTPMIDVKYGEDLLKILKGDSNE